MKSRLQDLIGEFSQFSDWESRYKHLIDLGKALPPLPEEFKVEDLKVKGCQSQVWIKADLTKKGEVKFRGDSDALLVKGLVNLLLRVYSEATPSEILSTSPQFFEELGFKSHLSPSRANGFYSMIKQIHYYATAYSLLLKNQP